MVAVEHERREVNPNAAIETLAQIRDDSLASRTFAMQLLVGFAVVGSMLALLRESSALRYQYQDSAC
jgi:putative ABC transport system permease protein